MNQSGEIIDKIDQIISNDNKEKNIVVENNDKIISQDKLQASNIFDLLNLTSKKTIVPLEQPIETARTNKTDMFDDIESASQVSGPVI